MIASRFLIDENLSVALPRVAHERGFEATHVNHIGLREWQDWNLLNVIRRDQWVFVTGNAVEFRSRYSKLRTHPGVVLILGSLDRRAQTAMFEAALIDVATNGELVDHALDIRLSETHTIIVRRYRLSLPPTLPRGGPGSRR